MAEMISTQRHKYFVKEGSIAFFNVMDPERTTIFSTKPLVATAQDAIDYLNKAWFSEGGVIGVVDGDNVGLLECPWIVHEVGAHRGQTRPGESAAGRQWVPRHPVPSWGNPIRSLNHRAGQLQRILFNAGPIRVH
ncbi:hypothetical protein [Paraburkholderia sp. BL6669N2]|uniref:hypothetical protein n=1 Tax=Paraburkholderia sp. BL6669N2 TaxID=1938807 RepID=UPI0015F27DA1